MTDHPDEDLIRARAHRIWQNEGCPEGQEADHWARAKAELEAAAAASAVQERGDEEGAVPASVAGPKARARAAR